MTLMNLTFYVLHPALPLGSDRKGKSIVLKVSSGQVHLLFAGDIESQVEVNMVATSLIDDIDTLKISHYGSKCCSTAASLAAAQPEIAINSRGTGNVYGDRATETVSRLDDVGAVIYGTDAHGTIVLGTDGTTYDVRLTNQVPPVTSYWIGHRKTT